MSNGALDREDRGDVTIVRILPPLLHWNEETESLFHQITSLIESEGRSQIVLNFAGVQFMASMALGQLVSIMRKAHAAGGRLALCCVPRPVSELLRVSRLTDLLIAFPDEEAAVRSFD
jgi:anti-anti-sigma factor